MAREGRIRGWIEEVCVPIAICMSCMSCRTDGRIACGTRDGRPPSFFIDLPASRSLRRRGLGIWIYIHILYVRGVDSM